MNTSDINKTHRNLPHWTKPGAIYWVTFRQTDSLPRSKMDLWRRERGIWIHSHPQPWTPKVSREYQIEFGERYEDWLDAGYGSCALAKSTCREVVKGCLFRFHEKRVLIHHGVIMPNHVHVLLEPLFEYRLSQLMQGIKGASSRECNRILDRNGPFWMSESYDHIVRNDAEYHHYIRYIDENPAKAGLKEGMYWVVSNSGFQPEGTKAFSLLRKQAKNL